LNPPPRCENIGRKIEVGTLPIAFTETSYQTAPLADYDAALRGRALDLFHRVEKRAPAKAREHKGSFSLLASASDATAAKILVYEAGKGKMNGHDPQLADGVYVLIRVPADAIGRTLGVAPNHHERFAYFRLADQQSLDEMADFIVACAAAQ
jgi:hypothetical protein